MVAHRRDPERPRPSPSRRPSARDTDDEPTAPSTDHRPSPPTTEPPTTDTTERRHHEHRRRVRPATAAPAVLVLEDGRTFRGDTYGATGQTVGEAVFSTGMTGYQETLTDPSYHRQVVVMTAPHVGNTGVNDEDDESSRIWVAGYVVRDPALRPSNWRSPAPARGRAASTRASSASAASTPAR